MSYQYPSLPPSPPLPFFLLSIFSLMYSIRPKSLIDPGVGGRDGRRPSGVFQLCRNSSGGGAGAGGRSAQGGGTERARQGYLQREGAFCFFLFLLFFVFVFFFIFFSFFIVSLFSVLFVLYLVHDSVFYFEVLVFTALFFFCLPLRSTAAVGPNHARLPCFLQQFSLVFSSSSLWLYPPLFSALCAQSVACIAGAMMILLYPQDVMSFFKAGHQGTKSVCLQSVVLSSCTR